MGDPGTAVGVATLAFEVFQGLLQYYSQSERCSRTQVPSESHMSIHSVKNKALFIFEKAPWMI